MTLPREFATTLERLQPSGKLLVAVSGGADSVAALRLALDAGREVVVAHFDHRLRAASGDDAEFVRHLCAELGVELVSGAADVSAVAEERGWNLEDAARRLRYEFLHRTAGTVGAVGIVVAHTFDDQVETFLMQLLRGSAFPSGMPERRGRVLRPLLGVARDRLRSYLDELAQAWREDDSNEDTSRTRAWTRHVLLPSLRERNPAVERTLADSAKVLGDAETALETIAAQLVGDDGLLVGNLAALPAALQRAALAGLLKRAGAPLSFDLIESVRQQVMRADREPHGGPWRKSVGTDRFVRVGYGVVEVVRRGRRRLLKGLPVSSLDEWRAVASRLQHAGLPEDDLVGELLRENPAGLELRHREPGDRVRLPGGGKSLADLLIDRKVPREERDALLLLACRREAGEPGEVVWLEGQPALGVGRDRDTYLMLRALALAREAAAAGELPVGAVVARGDEVIGAAANRTEADDDPSAHAELLALREAARATGDWRLEGATLYVTLEPCPMCFGAVLQTRVARVVYGADNRREGALGSVMDLRYGKWKRRPAVQRGVLASESAELLHDFFATRR